MSQAPALAKRPTLSRLRPSWLPARGRHRATEPYWSSTRRRTVFGIWAAFTALRWTIALLAAHFVTPTTTFAEASGLRALIGTWDAGIFLAIAGDGYVLDQDPLRAAFFPGFPAAEWTLARPLLLVVDQQNAALFAGLILTTACSLAAAFLLYRIADEQFDPASATWALVLFMAWPSAAFLTALYSESLYLVAAMSAWLLARRGRWVLAGVLCGVASFTRVTGAFLCVALVVMYLTSVLRREERFRWSSLAGVLLGAWGIAAYFLFLYRQTGDPLVLFHTQEAGWGRHTVTPWESIQTTWALMTSTASDNADWRWQMAADIVIVSIAAGLAVVMAIRRYWPELTLTALTLGSVVSGTYYVSVTRYTLSVFPLMVVGGSLLARRWLPTKLVVVGGSTAWMGAVMGTFALGYWSG